MKQIKKLAEVEIYKKNSGRYAVKNIKTKTWLKADEKIKVLLEQKLIKLTPAKPKAEPAPAAEAPAAS